MTEHDFIAALRALATEPAARGLLDDAAVLEIGGQALVLTQDTLLEGVHVRLTEDPADIAWKLVAVNLSDLAAKGARPIGVLVSHMLGDGDERFLAGLAEVLGAYDVPLLGGDTVRGPAPRSWTATALGLATHRPVPDRRGARPGDSVWVTGTLGRAMLGFEGDPAHRAAYCRPAPRLAEGLALAPRVTAMTDVSDGLLLDCWRLAGASGVAVRLESGTVPVAAPDRRDACLRWGDDYELLFTLPTDATPPDLAGLSVPLTRIGIVESIGTARLWLDGTAFESPDGLGYSH